MCDLRGVMWSLPSSARACFEDKNHWNLILTLPDAEGRALSVSLTSYNPEKDNVDNLDYGLIILDVGDIPLISHPTIPYFAAAVYMPCDKLKQAFATMKLNRCAIISGRPLFNIQTAALKHRLLSPEKKQLIQASIIYPD